MTESIEIPAVSTFLEESEAIIAKAIETMENGTPFHDTGTYVTISAALMFALTLDRAGLTEAQFAEHLASADVEIRSHDA